MANYTEKAIMQKFEEMLHEMPFNKITVLALVARCKISPNTFYYHYHDIYDLLDVWLDQILKKYPRDIYITNDWKNVLKNLLRELQKQQKLVNHVFGSLSREGVECYIFDILEPVAFQLVKQQTGELEISEETNRLLASILCYSLSGFIFKFVWSGMVDDVDETFAPVLEFLENSFRYYATREMLK